MLEHQFGINECHYRSEERRVEIGQHEWVIEEHQCGLATSRFSAGSPTLSVAGIWRTEKYMDATIQNDEHW